MLKTLLFILVASHGADFSVRHQQMPPNEFAVELLHKEEAPISTWFSHCQDHQKKRRLNQMIDTAQFHYLNSDLQKAKKAYQDILAQRTSCLWSKSARHSFFNSYLRLAQLAATPEKANQQLLRAMNFAPDLEPNKKVFSPPLIKKYEALKKAQPLKTHLWPSWAHQFHTVYRNGQLLTQKAEMFQAPEQKAHYIFLSDAFEPVEVLATTQQLETLQPKPKPFVTGDCKNPNWSSQLRASLKHQVLKAYYPQCLASSKGQKSEKIELSSNEEIRLKSATSDKAPKSWIRRNAYWLLPSLLASAVIVHESGVFKSDSGPAPSATIRTSDYYSNAPR